MAKSKFRGKRKPSQPNPNNRTLLPELWLEIITFLSVQDLRHLSKCSRTLRTFSIPYLFKTFVTHPFDGEQSNYSLVRQALGVVGIVRVRKPEDCLQVLSRPHISGVIETFAILPRGITLRNTQQEATEVSYEIDSLIDQLFELLPKLPKLKKLVCSRITLSKERVDILLHLPVKQLELQRCILRGFAPAVSKSPGTLESVTLVFYPNIFDPAWYDSEWVALFKALFSPSLKSIQSPNIGEVLYTMARCPPSITNLNIPVESVTSPHFVSAMGRCPQLHTISLTCRRGRSTYPPMHQLPPHSFPQLRYYAGPVEYLSGFIQGRQSIKGVHLVHTPFTAIPASSIELVPQAVESFECSFPGAIGSFLLPTIHSHFSSLKKLTIISRGLGLREALEDPAVIPLPGIRHFKASAFIGLRDDAVKHLEEYVPLLLRVYPGLEVAELVRPMVDESQVTLVWNRNMDSGIDDGRRDERDVRGSMRVLEMDEV
ncbi:hypothetical protein BDN72DRAFT_959861 [Pluteus cervinus]|uniref:Uncharacterized protein n=1 Tax=Pluteus cervinus TaxID=181527 RepID=A0ACD3AUH5_9AGAR|nr:hypothetical protein BDN72DRAFT_959861 [Pluteus cervinus]